MAEGGGGGAPAWMVTFADLMSLLLTLFILLLTFSELDVIKYKAIAGAMSSAFGVSREDKLAGMIELEGSKLKKHLKAVDPSRPEIEVKEVTVDLPKMSEEDIQEHARQLQDARMEALKGALRDAMRDEVAGSGIEVERAGDAVVMRFPSEIAFPSGSGELTPQFIGIIDKLAPIIKKTPGQVIVSGHTDNVPMSGGIYRSNWDLSSARATSVVHRFIEVHGVDRGRITVQGFADSRPLAPNDTPENRGKNRRVEVSIMTVKGDSPEAR